MGDGDARVGQRLFDVRGALRNGLDAVVQIVHLPAALQLTPHGVDQHRLGIFQHEGLHGVTVVRRLLNGGHIAQTGQRHVQRARDGCRGQGQDVHTAGKLLELLLMRHAEALLLVHDQKAEILKGDILLQQLVRADDQIAASRAQIGERLALLHGGGKARKHADVHRKSAKTRDGGGIMLLGKHSRRH